MEHVPTIDYKCSHCGASQIYQLVPADERSAAVHVSADEAPSLDFRCTKCGASQTYQLVPATAAT